MTLSSNVYLVGPMGAGKSTIGRMLAADLNLEFKDSDREIEERSGVDIPWIFDMEGEAGFRDRETAMLEELCQQPGIVLATGGGIVVREENRRLLAAAGMVVYLQADINEQVRRTSKDRKRPLLQTGDPRAVLEKLLAERHPLYSDIADFTVATAGRSPKSVVNEIKKCLQG